MMGQILISQKMTDFFDTAEKTLRPFHTQMNFAPSQNTHFFLYKKHKYKKHRARISSFSIANLRNSIINYGKSLELDPIQMFLIKKKACM